VGWRCASEQVEADDKGLEGGSSLARGHREMKEFDTLFLLRQLMERLQICVLIEPEKKVESIVMQRRRNIRGDKKGKGVGKDFPVHH